LSPTDFVVIDAGVLRADQRLDLAQRIGVLHDALFGLMQRNGPVVMVLEKAFYDKNVATAIKLGEVRGSFIAAAGRFGARVDEIAPARVKRLIAGNGQASKEQVGLAVQALVGFDRGLLPHDVTDALAIALSYALTLPAPQRADMRGGESRANS